MTRIPGNLKPTCPFLPEFAVLNDSTRSGLINIRVGPHFKQGMKMHLSRHWQECKSGA